MSTPFVFGKVVPQDNFTNRTKEIKTLHQHFNDLINCVIISPRRWGKSSLVEIATSTFVAKNKKYKVVKLDLFAIYNEQEFYEKFATACIKATSSKVEEFTNNVSAFLGKLQPNISIGTGPGSAVEFGIKLPDIKKDYSELLDLPQKIATEKKIYILVCIDEFQNIERFSNSIAFQQRLRASWQHHLQVGYCLYGSKRHMLINLFEKKSNPFYKFGDVMYLEKIKAAEWQPFIVEKFTATKKKIDAVFIDEIIVLMQEHPYYVQQLCSIVWWLTIKVVNKDIISQAVAEMLDRNNMLFQKDLDNITEHQLNCLRAIANGETSLSSKAVMDKYKLISSAHIAKSIKAVEEKEIINKIGKQIEIADPAFRLFILQIVG